MAAAWRLAPKDAQFWCEHHKNWYKEVDGELFWYLGCWRKSKYKLGDRVLGQLEPRPVVENEWIEHHGSNNPPVHPDTLVIAQLRIQGIHGRDGNHPGPAGDLRWNHRGGDGDVVAYKVVKKP